jgi:hypothetical protein
LRTLRKSDLGLGRADDSSTRVLEYSSARYYRYRFFLIDTEKKGITIIHYYKRKNSCKSVQATVLENITYIRQKVLSDSVSALL